MTRSSVDVVVAQVSTFPHNARGERQQEGSQRMSRLEWWANGRLSREMARQLSR